MLQLICNTYQADSLHRAITQANMSAATGCTIYAYLKFLIMGQWLVHIFPVSSLCGLYKQHGFMLLITHIVSDFGNDRDQTEFEVTKALVKHKTRILELNEFLKW